MGLKDDVSINSETRIGAVKYVAVVLNTLGGDQQDALVITGDNLLEFSLQGFAAFYHTSGETLRDVLQGTGSDSPAESRHHQHV